MVIHYYYIIPLKYYICNMDISQAIRSYAAQPLTHQLLLSLLKEYKRPNAKLHNLYKEGIIEPIKKGLYIAGPALNTNKPEPFLMANHILGPSYISVDTALSYYEMIPERVYEISSMTTKTSRTFQTPMGSFTYTRLPLPYYSFGIRQVENSPDQYAMIATPEKALFDKIVTTAGVLLRSTASVKAYLLDGLRIDPDSLKELDTGAMKEWLPDAPKKDTLNMVIKMIDNL